VRVARTLVLTVLGIALVAGLGCPHRASTVRDDPRARCVSSFLDAMVDEDEARMVALISPGWLDDEGIDLADNQLNVYTPGSYDIEEVKGTLVVALIRFRAGGAHRLTFRVSQEGNGYYIVPGRADADGWIHPWVDIETYVEE